MAGKGSCSYYAESISSYSAKCSPQGAQVARHVTSLDKVDEGADQLEVYDLVTWRRVACSTSAKHFGVTTAYFRPAGDSSILSKFCTVPHYTASHTRPPFFVATTATTPNLHHSLRSDHTDVEKHFLTWLWLPSRLQWILPSSGLSRGARWFKTDVSGLPTVPFSRVKLSRKGHRGPWR
jgi:hypothetical protein